MNNYQNDRPGQPDGYPYPSYQQQAPAPQPRQYDAPPVAQRPAVPFRPTQTVQQSVPSETQMGVFKPLSREERQEATRLKEQEGFSWAGYQVIHKELFSHKYDPTLTIKDNSISFNNSCISRLDRVVYVQLLINPAKQKLVIRPCKQDARDAIRWCIEKGESRKSRQITCKLFAAKLYEFMGWELSYRYKMQGSKIDFEGEELYVFDLSSTEIFLPQIKETAEDGTIKRKSRPPVLPINWRDSFGLPVDEHAQSTQVILNDEYILADMSSAQPDAAVQAPLSDGSDEVVFPTGGNPNV